MKRGVSVLDRIVVGLVGLAVIAGGVAAALWQRGDLPARFGTVETSAIIELTGRSWWPYALGGGGVVLALLALRLLIAQLPARGSVVVTLDPPGADHSAGHLLLDADAVAKRAASQASEVDGVRTARSRTTHERSTRVITLTVTTEPGADLDAVMTGLAKVRAEAASVVTGTPLGVRVLVNAR